MNNGLLSWLLNNGVRNGSRRPDSERAGHRTTLLAEAQAGHIEPMIPMWIGHRKTDNSNTRDNQVITQDECLSIGRFAIPMLTKLFLVV